MPFGAKTVKDFIGDIESGACGDTLDLSNNASLRMKPAENLGDIVAALKGNKSIKRLILMDCELPDAACVPLEELFKHNQSLEEVSLEKNKISSHGAKMIANGLADNSSVRTLNLLQQAVKSFGDDCLDSFVIMYGTNITLTKLTWRLDSRKSFVLAKLQTRNIEIQKRVAAGTDFNSFLPDALKSGAVKPAAPAATAGSDDAPAATAASDAAAKRPSVRDVEEHVAAIGEQLPDEEQATDEPAEDAPAEDAPAEAAPAAAAPAEAAPAEAAPAEAA